VEIWPCQNITPRKLFELGGVAPPHPTYLTGRMFMEFDICVFFESLSKKIQVINKQDRQCTCNVTSSFVRVTIVAVEKQYELHILSVCVCSLSYPACSAHAPYYIVICGLSGCTIFSHIIS
jgi:hypothetical protein